MPNDPRPAAPASFSRERLLVTLELLLLALLYGGTAHALNRFHAFWSPDSGARFAMIRNWSEHGSLIYLHYANADVDPAGRFHPLGTYHALQGYIVLLPKGFCTVYPPLFPLLTGIGYRLFGFDGLTLLPLLGGLTTVWAGYASARLLDLRSRLLLIPVVGLATPLALYSVVYWDHAVLMAIAALAGVAGLCGLQERGERRLFAAGAILGIGLWFHELILPLFVALAISLAFLNVSDKRRRLGALMLGFLLPALAWVLFNLCMYGAPFGPHLLGGNDPTGPVQRQLALSPAHILARCLWQLFGFSLPIGLLSLYFLFLIAYLISPAAKGGGRWATPLLGLAVGYQAWLRVRSAAGGRLWLNGLFQATPLFLPAFMLLPSPQETPENESAGPRKGRRQSVLRPEEAFFTWIRRACFVFAVIVFLSPITPELDWGSRYLLTLLPFLALLTAHALEREFAGAGKRGRYLALGNAVVLIGVSLLSQWEGFLAIRNDLTYSHKLNLDAQAVTSPVLVTDVGWLGAEISPTRLRPRMFLLHPDAGDAALFLSAVERLGVSEFVYTGSNAELTQLKEAALRRKTLRVFTPVEEKYGWSRRYVRFALRTRE